MNKFLYFSTGANSAYTYPLESLRQIDVSESGKLKFFFTPGRITDVAATDEVDRVTVSCGTDEKAAVANVVAAINAHPNGDPFIVVADSENSVFISGITACDSLSSAV